MNLIQAVGVTASAWLSALRGMLRPPVREPFLLLGGIELLLLIGLGFFHAPLLAPALLPVVRTLGGEGAIHYPEHFWALPELLRDASLAVHLLLAPFALATAVLRFAGERGRWSQASRRAPALLGIGLLGPGLTWTITTLFDLIPTEVALRSFVIRMGLQGVELLLIALVYTALAYAIAGVVLGERPIGRALAGSITLAGLLPLPTFFLVAVPLAALFPLDFFLFEMDVSQTGLAPETVGLLLALRVVLRMFLVALATGGLTDLYLRSKRRRT